MTGEPFTMAAAADRSSETSERSEERPSEQEVLSPSSLSSQWPTLEQAAYQGIAGRVVRTLEPYTEADPAGLLLTFLAAVGNIIGPGPHAIADAASHPARLNVVLVGQTSRARKGSAWAQIRRLLNQVDPTWASECILPGLASGEALIAEVRDAAGDDLGASDKRLLVLEPEFARLLGVASREGAILSAMIREAWDGNQLKNRTKRDPLVATGAHISVVGMGPGPVTCLVPDLSTQRIEPNLDRSGCSRSAVLQDHEQRASPLAGLLPYNRPAACIGVAVVHDELRSSGDRVVHGHQRGHGCGRRHDGDEAALSLLGDLPPDD